jgi:hypothetical protein
VNESGRGWLACTLLLPGPYPCTPPPHTHTHTHLHWHALRALPLPVPCCRLRAVERAGFGLAILPSTFMTMRFGARRWMGTMAVAWGVVSTCHALIDSRRGESRVGGARGVRGGCAGGAQGVRSVDAAGTWDPRGAHLQARLAHVTPLHSTPLRALQSARARVCACVHVTRGRRCRAVAAAFYALRCLLGAAEAAGTSSGGHLLAQFYPQDRCARAPACAVTWGR